MMQAPELPPFDYQPQPYRGPSAEEVLQLRRQFLNPGLFLYYKRPLMIVEGKAQYVFDEHGRRYLDALGGIVTISVGHCHPHVVEAARKQNELLQHSTTIYLHPNIAEYADMITLRYAYDVANATSRSRTGQGITKYNVPQRFSLRHSIRPDTYRSMWG